MIDGLSTDASAWVLLRAVLPLGKGAIILMLGGLFSLGFSLMWSLLSPTVVAFTGHPGKDRWGLPLLGAIIGGICAYLTYWSGAAFAAASALMQAPVESLPAEFARPFYTFTYWELVLIGVGAVLGGMIARYRWHAAGVLSYIGLVSLISGYFVYALTVSIPRVPMEERWISYGLFAAEAGGLGLVVVFAFYTLDAVTRRRWRRRPENIPHDPDIRPMVACEVPVFNEPPEMVEQTVANLIRQDYPKDRFFVVVADDSTDEEIRAKNREMCRRIGAHHVTREERTGFKAGALNHVQARLVDEVELVAVVDADYWVKPHYLRSIVGYFSDPGLSFVQTPQDYRNLDESFLTRRYKNAEAYFYHGIMPSRNEENTIIFCGTMGIIRRSALDQVGGFAEDQICEDAEVSVRLAAAGWRSLYVDESFGKGLMPAVFDAYKKQFYRWAFGNVKILLSRFGLIVRSKMSRRQKLDYLISNLHWFDGFFVVGVAAALLYLGLGPILGYDAVTHHQRELALLGIVPIVLLIDSVLRLHLVLGGRARLGWRETVLVQGMWFAIKMTNLRAVIKCLLGFKTPFIRTPKHPGHRFSIPRAFFRAFRLTKFESVAGSALVGVGGYNAWLLYLDGSTPWGYLLPAWLGLYGLFFLTAPIYAYLSYRTIGRRRNVVTVRGPQPQPHQVGHARRGRRLRGERRHHM